MFFVVLETRWTIYTGWPEIPLVIISELHYKDTK
jgi:hypothetical protein